ncbi:very short patch repair endonuclease [Nocardioides sp.]|uniref:very short patch repair endonuclease n=1 Tax=Nocardioides sp. TaxID=35761 RepID=UPI0037843757
MACRWFHAGNNGPMERYVSWASSPASRKVMQGNRSRDTSPELAVRRRLHAAGLRFRVAHRPEPSLRRTADIVFTKQRIAVFIDGCYWHACPQHRTIARSNAPYWAEKLRRNVARDADTTAQLCAAGWTVLRFWEHEEPDQVAAAVVVAVRRQYPR